MPTKSAPSMARLAVAPQTAWPARRAMRRAFATGSRHALPSEPGTTTPLVEARPSLRATGPMRLHATPAWQPALAVAATRGPVWPSAGGRSRARVAKGVARHTVPPRVLGSHLTAKIQAGSSISAHRLATRSPQPAIAPARDMPRSSALRGLSHRHETASSGSGIPMRPPALGLSQPTPPTAGLPVISASFLRASLGRSVLVGAAGDTARVQQQPPRTTPQQLRSQFPTMVGQRLARGPRPAATVLSPAAGWTPASGLNRAVGAHANVPLARAVQRQLTPAPGAAVFSPRRGDDRFGAARERSFHTATSRAAAAHTTPRPPQALRAVATSGTGRHATVPALAPAEGARAGSPFAPLALGGHTRDMARSVARRDTGVPQTVTNGALVPARRERTSRSAVVRRFGGKTMDAPRLGATPAPQARLSAQPNDQASSAAVPAGLVTGTPLLPAAPGGPGGPRALAIAMRKAILVARRSPAEPSGGASNGDRSERGTRALLPPSSRRLVRTSGAGQGNSAVAGSGPAHARLAKTAPGPEIFFDVPRSPITKGDANDMSYYGNRQMVSRWAPARPRSGRPGGGMPRPASGDADAAAGPSLSSHREQEVRSPSGPRISEELSTLADMLAERYLADLERCGRFLRPEVF